MSEASRPEFCLVVSNIEAQNVGFSLGDQRHDKQLVQIELKGKKKQCTDTAIPCDSPDGKDGCRLFTKWEDKSLTFDLDKKKLEGKDKIRIKVFQYGIIRNKLLAKADLSLEGLVCRDEKKKTFELNLYDGHNRPMESMFKCEVNYSIPEEQRSAQQDAANNKMASKTKDGKQIENLSDIQTGVQHPKRIREYPDKALDFQVQVKVIEARQLEGGPNINPVITIAIDKVKKHTRVQDTTNRPYYNQTFAFNFPSTTFADLFDKHIQFEVLDSGRFRSDALIGFYKCDVRDIYALEGHILLRKWIMLAEPEESEMIIEGSDVIGKSLQASGVGGAPAGFVKVSMAVLEAGVSAASLEDCGGGTADDDIESNLLKLPGVTLTPAMFKLRIYKAEDLPQMDPKIFLDRKSKDWVDPYCEFSFAGRKATSVIKYDEKNPDFNQQLNVPFHFPSMCDKLKIQLMDWDRHTADDHIGAVFLSLPSISGDGTTGFLPTFGPCYVNLYGSPREFCNLPSELDELNEGIGEGVAYRGRVLVELETKLYPERSSETEPIVANNKVQAYRARKQFHLLATFLEATMLAVQDSSVQFEVSIGNYGNKLDDSVSPSPSSTAPMNPVSDGHRYYYIPWGNTKPYVSIDCEWEDITFRLGTLNKLLSICATLENNMEEIKKADSGDKYDRAIAGTLGQLIDDCSSLPELDEKYYKLTALDLQMRERRLTLLTSIATEAEELTRKLDNSKRLQTIERFLKRIQAIAVEPQNSMPDVIIWMLKGGTQRVAYCRIPAYKLLYTPEEEQRGVHCGKIIDINLKYPGDEAGTKNKTFPALLRVMLWFGLKQHERQWDEWKKTGGELSVYAETYENQSFWVDGWSPTNWRRPPFSNANGTRSLPKDNFVAPDGWKFVSKEWEIRPELSIHYANDSGCSTFLEDAFENEARLFPGGKWRKKDTIVWTDIVGEVLVNEEDKPIKSLDDIKLPIGWQWSEKDKWNIDDERAVDNYGWEYTVETSFGSTNYESSEKMYHFCRRRRWIRERKKISGIQARRVSKEIEPNKEGWEYAVSFGTKFHTKKKGFDMVRRRRLHKKLVMIDDNAAEPIFRFEKDEKSVLIPPSIFLYFKEPNICQFRAYLYQGRNVLPADSDGLADPYVHMSFGTRSETSKTIIKKLSPTWDQMLVLESVPIYGHYDQVIENPPDVLLEIFDKDPVGKDDLLGRVQSEPIVIIPDTKPASETKLSWIKIYKDSCHCGDVLAAFELYMDESVSAPPLPSPDENDWYPIPPSVRPVMQKTAVEILCWGLRNLSRFRWASVKSPSIEVEIGDTIQKTSVIKNLKANPNFETKRLLYFNVDLPRDHIYTPPITIRLRSNSSYGHPIIGVCVVDNLRKFERSENQFALVKKRKMTRKKTRVVLRVSDSIVQVASEHKAQLESTVDDDEIEEPFDWWSKYDASKKGFVQDKLKGNKSDYPANYDRIQVYPHSLEEEFDHFQDFLKTFHLRRGKVESPSEQDDEDSIVGEFKGNLSIYSLPEDPDEPLPPKMFVEQHLLHGIQPVHCLVRVYIIKAYNLSPRDSNGLADPYLIVSLGTQKFDEQKNYEASTLDVEFGKVFEFNAEIPLVKDLKIKVMDYDGFTKDDLIGETIVDLESRLLSRLHATTGLPATYNKSGINKWRLGASYTPSTILKNYCDAYGADDPVFRNANSEVVLKSSVKGSKVFSIKDFEDGCDTTNRNLNESKAERLSLHVLNSFKDDLKLVPEHVETRELVNSLYPTFPQGKLEMFVDIFPEANGYPGPPLNIAPRTPKKYELRVIVWNTKDVFPQETNLLGEEMSDIYVKCKLNGVSDVQKSDVHYRSLNGEGMFNWRMVFPFEYSEADEMLIVRKKANFFSMRKFQEKRAPELNVEVWDNDLISRDDFIGSVRLNLQDLPSPYSSAKKIEDFKLRNEKRSLFEKRSVKGWWPVEGKRPKEKKKKKDNSSIDTEDGHGPALTGKVEMTLELLESKDAEARPVGKGRDKPNQHPFLEKPNRPATSFLWITNPWKSFRFIFWRRYKWYIIGLIILILIVLLVGLFIYSAPGYSVKKLFKA